LVEQAIEAFARTLVEAVRDATIQGCDAYLAEDSQAPIGKRWSRETTAEGRDAIRVAIPDIVDETLFYLLNRAFDQGLLPLLLRTASGDLLDLGESGELSGWYLTEWRQRFAVERFQDDFT
jgi:hypothetical protein